MKTNVILKAVVMVAVVMASVLNFSANAMKSYGLRKERGNERRTGNSPDNLPYFIAKQR